MRSVWKVLKWTLLIFGGLILLILLGTVIFVGTASQFGQPPEGTDLERISRSPNYVDGEFVNNIETTLGSFSDMLGTLPKFLSATNLHPEETLPVRYGQNHEPPADSIAYVTWFGHSAFLVEMEGKRILLDPMFGDSPSPVSFGSKRFSNEAPIPALTHIDYVILSHDHYDHLDYQSILDLEDQVSHFFTALGVGSHLKAWGIPESKITELDWWESANISGIEFTATPARHFSGRGLWDRNATQWASWVINGKYSKIYFSGDGGYGPHFIEIGEKYGPFDLAMLECGQYNLAWRDIHMLPEESVQAGIDVNAKVVMPIHWGAFALAVHPWKEPVERFKAEALRSDVRMIHPFIGERFAVGVEYPAVEWWKGVE